MRSYSIAKNDCHGPHGLLQGRLPKKKVLVSKYHTV